MTRDKHILMNVSNFEIIYIWALFGPETAVRGVPKGEEQLSCCKAGVRVENRCQGGEQVSWCRAGVKVYRRCQGLEQVSMIRAGVKV